MNKNILIVAATKSEIPTLFEVTKKTVQINENLYQNEYSGFYADILITSVGMVSTACNLTKALSANTYDYIINAGICGAYSLNLAPGTVVHIAEDCFAELGAEDSESIRPLHIKEDGKDILVEQTVINKNEIKINSIQNLMRVKGASVHTVTRSEMRNKMITVQYDAVVESMEGAAFLYVCNEFNIPCAQIRSVSNYAGCPTNKNWYIDMAVNNLCKTITDIIEEIIPK